MWKVIERPLPLIAIRVPSTSGGQARTFHNTTQVESQPFGMGVTGDLGGGACVQTGLFDPDNFGEDDRADIGVTFNL